MTLAEIDLPHIVSADLMCIITDTIANQPRTLQQVIGPSEIGVPCTRRLIHKLAGHQEPLRRDPAWLAYIGSCVHAGIEQGFRNHPLNQAVLQPRYLLEHRVCVGQAYGQAIWGNADVFDIDSGTVVDWKIVGPDRLKHYIAHGPGPQYRTQAHSYGRGFARLGYLVRHVMIVFLPRNGQLFNAHVWAEPYDESVAVQGLDRVEGLLELIDQLGAETLVEMYPPCADWFCGWCKATRGAAKSIPTSTAELFG